MVDAPRCSWQQDLEAHAKNRLVFRCTVCNKTIRICQRVIDSHFGGSIDPVLENQLPCGVFPVKQMPGVHQILMDGPAQLKATLDRMEAAGRTMPPITRRLGSYAKAIARWNTAGRPVRLAEEVQHIITGCCGPCMHFNKKRKSCNLCGCRVRASGKAFLNKAAMGTERCPDNPPKWVEMPGYEQDKEEN